MSTLTPPPVGEHRPVEAEPPRRPASGLVVAILLIALGALVIVGTVLTSVFSTAFSTRQETANDTLAVAGAQQLQAEVAAGSLRIRFADVDEATLEVTGALDRRWTLERQGDTVVVASPRRGFGMGWWHAPTTAVLTLPETLDGRLDADFTLAAGELRARGTFADVAADVAAGALTVAGAADTVDVEVSAGGADLDLADVSTAAFRVSAGGVNAALTGSAPDAVVVDVSAGGLELSLPDATYDVTTDADGGRLSNDLPTRSGAASTVDVSVSAGSVALRTR